MDKHKLSEHLYSLGEIENAAGNSITLEYVVHAYFDGFKSYPCTALLSCMVLCTCIPVTWAYVVPHVVRDKSNGEECAAVCTNLGLVCR
jgi:hypothetical protein